MVELALLGGGGHDLTEQGYLLEGDLVVQRLTPILALLLT